MNTGKGHHCIVIHHVGPIDLSYDSEIYVVIKIIINCVIIQELMSIGRLFLSYN